LQVELDTEQEMDEPVDDCSAEERITTDVVVFSRSTADKDVPAMLSISQESVTTGIKGTVASIIGRLSAPLATDGADATSKI
jgi:hypothetical protein